MKTVHGLAEWAFLLAAGLVAGVIGTVGGITSLVAYPALLVAGLPALAANVTNSVALLGSGLGSALVARPDLVGHRRTVRVWTPPVVLLSFGGAILLVVTPGDVFADIVPLLVAAGSLILLSQPAIARRQAHRDVSRAVVWPAAAVVAVYNGYFGAGSGILLIALLMLTTESVLHRANALKNVILFAADVLPAVVFAVTGHIVWHAVWPLAIGALGGGTVGPAIARRVPASVLRVLIGACGLGLAAWLLVRSLTAP